MKMTLYEKELAEKHLALVPKVVTALTKPYKNISLDEIEELTQIGNLALCKAAMHYDNLRPFPAYAKVVIRHEIYDHWRKYIPHKERVTFLDSTKHDLIEQEDYILPTTASPEQTVINHYLTEYLTELKKQNNTTFKKGIDSLILKQQGYNSTDLGKIYGVPSNHVRTWISKAKKVLQNDEILYSLIAS